MRLRQGSPGSTIEKQEWLGTTIRIDGVEMSGMVWLFHQWGSGIAVPSGDDSYRSDQVV
jgi:hypothetical protein